MTVTSSNGCADTENIIITQDNSVPTAGIINNSATTILTCSTTSISVTATGGGTYSWSDGSNVVSSVADLSILAPGTYTVTVTSSNGCSNTDAVTITQDSSVPTAGIINNSATTILTCSSTSISVTTTGGGTYSWSDGSNVVSSVADLSILAPGTYTVTVTSSNGCSNTDAVTITQDSSKPTAGITNTTASTVLTCSTTSISVTATGGGTYSWSDGTAVVSSVADLSISAPGTYTVTVTSLNGCTDTDAITITQDNSVPTAGITNNTGVTVLTCSTESISVTANGGGTYSWSDGSNVVSSVADLSISGTGTYTVTVTSSNGCSSSDAVSITQDSSIPTAGITNITGSTVLNSTTPSISLTATGGSAYSWSDGTNVVSSVANLLVTSAGIYTVKVSNANGCFDTKVTTITQGVLAPATQASVLIFSGVQTTQFTVSWTNGSGSRRVAFAKKANTGTTTPVDLTTYVANSHLASGTQIGTTGWYCVYNGLGTTVSVTGLTAGTNYIIQVFDYNGTAGSEKYNPSTASNNPLSTATVTNCSNPTSGGVIAVSQTICSGSAPATFMSTSAAAGNIGTLQYQWQSSVTSNSGGFTNIAFANSATYKSGNLSLTTWFRRLSRVICASDWSGAAASNVLQITVNALPGLFTVTGSTGVAIGLTGSQTGVNYQLVLGNSSIGTPVTGTGSALIFGIQSAPGTYTIVATNATTLCSDNMSGSAMVSSGSSVYTVTGGGSYCAGGSGLPIGLSGSKRGVLYQLKLNGHNQGNVIAGSGSAISFGLNKAAGTYTVTAFTIAPLTSVPMNGSAVVTINPLPSAPGTITGATSICISKTTLLHETTTGGVWSSSNPAIASISNTGIVTGHISGSSVIRYTVTNGSGCSNSASVTVIVSPAAFQPGNFTVYSANVRQGQRNVNYSVPAVAGISYVWYYSGSGAAIIGTTNSISANFATNATSGILSVYASTSCGLSPPRSLYINVSKNIFKSDSIVATSIPVIAESAVPTNELKLFPNPTQGPATFIFRISENARAKLDIYSLTGQHILQVYNGDVIEGVPQTVLFEQLLPTGIYLCVLSWNGKIITLKLAVAQ